MLKSVQAQDTWSKIYHWGCAFSFLCKCCILRFYSSDSVARYMDNNKCQNLCSTADHLERNGLCSESWPCVQPTVLSAWLVLDNVLQSASKRGVSQHSSSCATSKGKRKRNKLVVSDEWLGSAGVWVKWGGRKHVGAMAFRFPMLWQQVTQGELSLSCPEHPPPPPALSAPHCSPLTSPLLCPAFGERKKPKCYKRPRVAQFQTPGQHVFSEQECKKYWI